MNSMTKEELRSEYREAGNGDPLRWDRPSADYAEWLEKKLCGVPPSPEPITYPEMANIIENIVDNYGKEDPVTKMNMAIRIKHLCEQVALKVSNCAQTKETFNPRSLNDEESARYFSYAAGAMRAFLSNGEPDDFRVIFWDTVSRNSYDIAQAMIMEEKRRTKI
jgi:hypothetical protein